MNTAATQPAPIKLQHGTFAGAENARKLTADFQPKKERAMLKQIVLIMTLTFAGAAMAQDASCEAKATEKKLAGAAKTSFLRKCDKDAMAMKAQATCEASSAEKKLAGAAKASFVKKCGKDAMETSAKATCEAASSEKKLAGAAKTSFEKKCVKDAVG